MLTDQVVFYARVAVKDSSYFVVNQQAGTDSRTPAEFLCAENPPEKFGYPNNTP